MQEQLMALTNKILLVTTGSHLYGTANENSDLDFVGIFIPDIEYILGFKRIEEVDFSKKVKDENGKNTKEARDEKYYEFRKFIQLALDNNPNILELLFVDRKNLIFINDIGEKLLDLRHSFVHRGLKQKFLGYAFSQKHKMFIKKDNYFDLVNGLSYIKSFNYAKSLMEIVLENNIPHFIKKVKDKNDNLSFIQIGDLNFNPSNTVKNVTTKLQERIDKVGNREELITKYGYDTKFASHLIRLMFEGIELLKTGELQFPLKEAQTLKDIRNGKWNIQNILDFSIELEKEVELAEIRSKLPAKPQIDKIEKFTISTLREFYDKKS